MARIKTYWGRTKKARDNMAWALWRIRDNKRTPGIPAGFEAVTHNGITVTHEGEIVYERV